MKLTSMRLPFFIALCFVFFSCKKETDKSPSLIEGTWYKVKIETRQGSDDFVIQNAACQLDDVEEYTADQKWTMYDGPNQCNAGTGITRGTWRLTAGNSKIIYTYDGYSGEYESTVQELTDSKLVVIFSAGDLNNTQYRYTFEK